MGCAFFVLRTTVKLGKATNAKLSIKGAQDHAIQPSLPPRHRCLLQRPANFPLRWNESQPAPLSGQR